MNTLFLINLMLCLFSGSFDRVLSYEKIEEVTAICCTQGEDAAVTATSCAGVALPEDIEPEQKDVCLEAVASCCEQQMKNKESCAAGLKLAAANNCNTAQSAIGKICCEECIDGRLTGKSQGQDVCGSAPSPEDAISPFSALRKGAYYSCCVEAAGTQTQ